MRTIIAIVIGIMIAGSAWAQEWKAVVIKASSFKDDGSGNLSITLTSGATIEVPKADWSSEWSQAVDEALRNQEAEKAARSSAEPPSDAAASAMIRSHCAKEWPGRLQDAEVL